VRRGATSNGIATAALLLAVLLLAGCGGGLSSVPSGRPHSTGELRSKIEHIMDRRLAKFGASATEIACVDRVIETSSPAAIGRRLTEGDVERPHRKKTPKQVAGALGGNCF
jgi:hypothetical protein